MDGTVVGTLGKRRRMRTFVRPRPPKEAGVDTATEAEADSAVWAFDDRSISEKGMRAPPAPASGTGLQPPAAMFMSVYQFDRVFSCQADNYDVYDHAAKGIVQRFCDGRNGTVLIYGQTSSGKTNTMLGSSEDPGIVAWSVSDIFSHISESMGREFLLRVSCFELHCEVVKDLLKPDTANALNVYEDPVRGFCVAALTEQVVGSAEQIMELLLFAEANRHVNTHSKHSRSHTVFRLLLESGLRAVPTKGEGEAVANNVVHAAGHAAPISASSLHIVDLAGSEGARGRAGSGGVSRTQLINKSLNQLHTVVAALSKGSTGAAQVPYHGSVLTQILRESLGGNSDAALICTISIAKAHQLHTRRSLQFASTCAAIQNSPCVQQIPAAQAMLPKWVAEMSSLQQQISTTTAASQANERSDNETHQEMVMRSVQTAQTEAGLASLEDKLEDMRKFLLVPESVKRFEQTLSTLAADVQNHLGGNQQRHRFMSPELLSTLDTLKDMCNVEHFWKRDAADGTATDRSGSHGNLLFILNKSLLQAKEQARMLRSALVEQEGELDETRCMLEQELDRNPVRRLASPSKAPRETAAGAGRELEASIPVGTPTPRSSAKKRAVRRASLTTPNVPESSPKASARRHSFTAGRRRSLSRRRPSLSKGVIQSSNQKQDANEHSTAIARLVEECSEPETMLDAAIYFGRDERVVVQVSADTKPQELAATLIRQHNLPRDLLGSVAAQLGEALVEALKRELTRARSHAKKSVDLLLSAPPSESLNSEMAVRLEHAEARAAEANEELAFIQQCKMGPLQEECSMLKVEHEKMMAEIEGNQRKVVGAQESKAELEGQVKALEAVLQRYSREAGRAHNTTAIREGRHEIRGLKRRVDQLEALLVAKEEMLRMAQVKIQGLSAAGNTPGSASIFDALYSPLAPPVHQSDENFGEIPLPSTAMMTHGVSASEATNPTVLSTPRATGTATDVSTSSFPAAIHAPQVVASISGGMETTATSAPVAVSIATDVPPKPARRATGLGRLFGANSGQVGSSQLNGGEAAPVHRRSFTHDDDEPATLLGGVPSIATPHAPIHEQKQKSRSRESSKVPTSRVLRLIFSRFKTVDRTSKGEHVTLFQLHQCCRDTRICGANGSDKTSTVLRGDIDIIFSRVRGKSKGGAGLSLAQFCNAMELLARKRFAVMLENQELQRSQALDELCQLLLEPFALDAGLLAAPAPSSRVEYG